MKTLLVYLTILVVSGLFFIEYNSPIPFICHVAVAMGLGVMCSIYIPTDKDMINALFPWTS